MSLGNLIYLILILKLQLAMMQQFDATPDEFWSTLLNSEKFAEDYDTSFKHDYVNKGAQEFEAYAYANTGSQQKQTQNQKHFENSNNPAYNTIPNDSKEEIYVFLDKGKTRYMPMNKNDRIKITHGALNINGQNAGRNEWKHFNTNKWSNNYQPAGHSYGNRMKLNHRNARNFRRPHNCHQKHGKQLRPGMQAQEILADYDYRDEIKPNFGRYHNGHQRKNYKKNNRKNYQNDIESDNESQNQGRNKNYQQVRQKINPNCVLKLQPKKKVITNNTATVEKQTVQVQSETETSLGSSKQANNGTSNIFGNSRSASELGRANESNKPLQRNENDFNNGSHLQSKALGSNKTENNKSSIHKNEKNKPVDDANETSSLPQDLPLTDSPITYIKILSSKQEHKKRRRPIVQNPTLMKELEKIASTATKVIQNNLLQREEIEPMRDSKQLKTQNIQTDELSEETLTEETPSTTAPKVEGDAETETETEDASKQIDINLRAQSINNELNNAIENENAAVNGPTGELESKTASEFVKNMSKDTDLSPSEDRLYTYVTKLDGTAPNLDNNIKYMEPIAYEALTNKANVNEKLLNHNAALRFISKLKRNVKNLANDSHRQSKPRKKKSKHSKTTETTTPEPLIFTTTAQMVEPKLQLIFQNDEQNANDNTNSNIGSQKGDSILRPAQRFSPQANNKQMNIQQDSQDLDSERSFTEEENNDNDNDSDGPCEYNEPLDDDENNNEDDYDRQSEDEKAVRFNAGSDGIELYSAELNNSPANCIDPSDVSLDGDQHIENVIGTVTPAPRRHSDEHCMT